MLCFACRLWMPKGIPVCNRSRRNRYILGMSPEPRECESHYLLNLYKRENKSLAFKKMARLTGLEPATPGVTGRYSNQLSYNRA